MMRYDTHRKIPRLSTAATELIVDAPVQSAAFCAEDVMRWNRFVLLHRLRATLLTTMVIHLADRVAAKMHTSMRQEAMRMRRVAKRGDGTNLLRFQWCALHLSGAQRREQKLLAPSPSSSNVLALPHRAATFVAEGEPPRSLASFASVMTGSRSSRTIWMRVRRHLGVEVKSHYLDEGTLKRHLGDI